jgi:hypothetical protein
MPLSASTPFYAFQKKVGPWVAKANTAVTINLGDMLMWDSGAVTPVTASSDASKFVGICEGQIPISSNVDNQIGLENQVRVNDNGVFLMDTTNGDTLVHGDAVKIGATPQMVVKDSTDATIVGYVWLPDGTSIVGNPGTRCPIRIRVNYPEKEFAS